MKAYLDADRIMKSIEKAESGKRGDGKGESKPRKDEIENAFFLFSSACVDMPGKCLATSITRVHCSHYVF